MKYYKIQNRSNNKSHLCVLAVEKCRSDFITIYLKIVKLDTFTFLQKFPLYMKIVNSTIKVLLASIYSDLNEPIS